MAPKATATAAKALRQCHAEQRAAKEAAGWKFHEELRLDGCLPLVAGRLFRVSGKRGWFKFRSADTTPDGRVQVHCHGPYNVEGTPSASRCVAAHTFWGERVTKVARKVTPARC